MPVLRRSYTSRLAATRLIVARFRVSDSIASATASGVAVGFSRSSAVRNRDIKHDFGGRLSSERAGWPHRLVRRRYRLPAQRCEELNRGLFDELVFGVGVRHRSGGGVSERDLAREEARQQQIACAAEVVDQALKTLTPGAILAQPGGSKCSVQLLRHAEKRNHRPSCSPA